MQQHGSDGVEVHVVGMLALGIEGLARRRSFLRDTCRSLLRNPASLRFCCGPFDKRADKLVCDPI